MTDSDAAGLEKGSTSSLSIDRHDAPPKQKKWSLGVLNDPQTDEVPGSILLLSGLAEHNAPFGLQHTVLRTSSSSLPSPFEAPPRPKCEKKRTKDGKIILDPQPEESLNDPLNWTVFRRDAALLSLGFYCMVGGGMTTVLAPAFDNVAQSYGVSVPRVALTTGLYMMGLGVGSVIASPTAIAFGKRPVYLVAALIFMLTSIWCALSPSFTSLIVGRVVQGLAVSPVECLPSATIAEIYFLHERAYRVGIYTLLLLGGKNLVPLVSAAIVQGTDWEWIFWVVSIIVGFCACLLFFFVPETFWDRTPRPHRGRHLRRSFSRTRVPSTGGVVGREPVQADKDSAQATQNHGGGDFIVHSPLDETETNSSRPHKKAHFDDVVDGENEVRVSLDNHSHSKPRPLTPNTALLRKSMSAPGPQTLAAIQTAQEPSSSLGDRVDGATALNSIHDRTQPEVTSSRLNTGVSREFENEHDDNNITTPNPLTTASTEESLARVPISSYTSYYRTQPPKTYLQTLKPWSGRLTHDNWFRVALRPFVLYAYPSILWSAMVYALSVGWLIVLSESVTTIYRNPDTYNFSALQVGLIYISPFLGGVLGTAVAGKVSDIIVRFMSKRNNGIYEPEFRLVMTIPMAFATVIGLMGYGWSAAERDAWIVPTVFFGTISFGCTLGSTTAITFAVDSYRQYAGEALVTLNFSKNILHGLVFSLFFNSWLDADGSKTVFLAIGGIQLGFLLFTVPMYLWGKRARMWTVRRNLMEKL